MRLFRFIKQKKAKLANGQVVRFGDNVQFTNSDGEVCRDIIKRRADGTLYFWNQMFQIEDYKSAVKV